MLKKLGFIACISLIFFSCKRKVLHFEGINFVKKMPSEQVEHLINSQSVHIPKVAFKSSISVKGAGFIPTMNAEIQIDSGRQVYIHLGSFFINIATALATPSQVEILDRINKIHIVDDYSYANQLLGFDFLDYQTWERLLLGQSFIPIRKDEFDFFLTEKGNFALMKKKPFSVKLSVETKEFQLVTEYDKDTHTPHKLFVKSEKDSILAQIDYQEWEKVGAYSLPKKMQLSLQDKKSTVITFNNRDFTVDFVEKALHIPDNYNTLYVN